MLIPTVAAKGYDNYVPSELIRMEKEKARKFGINSLVGDIHSHPRGLLENLNFRGNDIDLMAEFSVADYYAFLNSRQNIFMGVVDGNYNLFMFKSRQTHDTTQFVSAFTQGSFEKYWYEMYGYKYPDSVKESSARITPINGYANKIGMHKAILDKHSLVLYQGYKNKDITRIYPK